MPNNLSNNQSYVKFLRGSTEAWESLKNNYPQKIDNDTLYFIYDEENIEIGKLYLGQRLISGGESGFPENASIADLQNVYIDGETLANKQLLVYNANTSKWENASLSAIMDTSVSVMTGASALANGTAGLVPAPQAGDEDKFLRGDGTWQPVPTSNLSYDIKTENELNELIEAEDASLNNTIFLVPRSDDDIAEQNLYDEFMVINNQLEKIGSFGTPIVDLTGYLQTGDLENALGQTKIGNLNNLILSDGNSTLVEEMNNINDRLQWKSISV